MSQQINLYDPSLERQRDWLSGLNVVAGTVALVLALGAWGAWTRIRLAAVETEAQAVASQLKTLQDQNQALAAQLANLKPDPRLADDLAAARAEAENRQAVLAVLDRGLGPEATSFAEYLRGLARQGTRGLWLTGFSVDADGGAMEIRGRMADPAALPDYIRRLNNEKVFQGRSFAALQLKGTEPPPATPAAPAASTPSAAPAAPPAAAAMAYTEFVLVPAKPAAAPVVKRP